MATDSKLMISSLIGEANNTQEIGDQNQITFSMRLFTTDKEDAKDIYLRKTDDFQLIPYELDINYPTDVTVKTEGNCKIKDKNLDC